MTGFRLDKWYFDCVSPAGDVLVGYAAKLRWGPLGLHYGARITKSLDAPLSQRQSLSFGRVEADGNSVTWSNDALGVSGSWRGGRGFESVVLLDGPDGLIEWQCLGANSRVRLSVDGVAVEGLGYAEKLSMTVPPWRLPFRELRWGRFISHEGGDYAVWIDLRGGLQRNWTWMNGTTAVQGTVDGAGVLADGGELLFEVSQPLRRENVARTLLGRLQFLSRLLPRDARLIQEDKYVSSCVLRGKGPESKGMSIHEVVRWS